MLTDLLTDSLFDFIEKNAKEDISRLRLRLHEKKLPFDLDFALLQIECRRKTNKKLSDFLANRKFIFPSSLAAEQASHQSVASYHSLMAEPGDTVLDMTAGLGIDSISFAKKGAEVTAIEIEKIKCEVLSHNALIENLNNLSVINADSTEWLRNFSHCYDVIFIDPARRGEDKSRLYNLRDCFPDIVKLQDELRKHSRRLLIKASPMIDISQTLKDIQQVSTIHVVCVEGECKEILIEVLGNADLSKPKNSISEKTIDFIAIDLEREGNVISKLIYSGSDEGKDVEYANSLENNLFLYEPNAAVMKLAPWRILLFLFPEIKKLAPDSHIFVSSTLYHTFPGRIMRINKEITKKDRKTIKGLPINIVSRNYPLSANELRRTIGAKEGKNEFLYATRIGSNPILIDCTKI